MSPMTDPTVNAIDPELIADVVSRYLAVWSEPDPGLRRRAITGLWAPDGAEFVEAAQFRGHQELEARITAAHQAFVASGTHTVVSAGDVTAHHDIVTFTIQLAVAGGGRASEIAWSARVFLILGQGGLIAQDYHLTVQPLAAD